MIDPSIPLVDLHRHLDGNIRIDTVIDLCREHNLDLPAWDEEGLRPYVQVTVPQPGVMAFIAKFHYMIAALVDYDACRRVAYENVIDAQKEGIDYVELRFSPWFMAESHDLNPSGVVEAVLDGIQSGVDDADIRVNAIGIISRTYGPDVGWKELEALLDHREGIVALDLAGDEINSPGDLYVQHFQKARNAGWGITVHAGESTGAQSIWQAIKDLGATRIGHGVTADEDPALLDYILENKIGLEANLTSNVQTSTVQDYASHPLLGWLERGMLVSLNTDDPSVSGIDLRYEYEIAAPAAGLNKDQIRQLQRNGVEMAFLSAAEKIELMG